MHPHLIAQRLNNSAALCIEAGHYDRAVSSLVEALKLADHCGGGGGSETTPSNCCCCCRCDVICQCQACSLDECIVFSDSTPPLMTQKVKNENNNHNNNHNDGAGDGYVHRRPIRVTPRSLHEGHNMGVTLSLIITFNIALAHHLSALSDATPSRGKLRKILHLYELAYKWQAELEDSNDYAMAQQHRWEDRNNASTRWTTTSNHHCHRPESSIVTSLRFNMIICNNLSQIHRLVDNKRKSIRCLEHLLRSVMFVVDTTATNGGGNNDGDRRRHPAMMMELEGFLQNATSLILQEQCAGAA